MKQSILGNISQWAKHVTSPVALLDESLCIDYVNEAWKNIFANYIDEHIRENINVFFKEKHIEDLLISFLKSNEQDIHIDIQKTLQWSGSQFELVAWKDEEQSFSIWLMLRQIQKKNADRPFKNKGKASVGLDIAPYECRAIVKRNFLHIDSSFEVLTGYPFTKFLKTDLQGLNNLVHPADRPKVESTIKQAVAQQIAFDLEYRIIDEQHTIKWISDRGRVYQNEQGELLIKGLLYDISASKNVLIAKGESYYTSIFNIMNDGAVVHNLKDEVISCNQAALDILGLSLDQLTGKTSLDPRWKAVKENGNPFLPGEHPSMLTLNTGKPQKNVVMGVYHSAKKLVWISINSKPLLNEVGEMKGVIVTFGDITHIKKLHGVALANQMRFKRLFEAVNYPITIVNRKGEISLFNGAFKQLFGYKRSELLNSTISRVMREADRHRHDWMIERFFTSSEFRDSKVNIERDVSGQKKDGEVFPVRIRLNYLQFENKEYAICMIKDLTEDAEREKLNKAYKKITDSIRYAQRIQLALLDNHNRLLDDFKDAMIFFRPKDIVSGDFYWYEAKQQIHLDEKSMAPSMTKMKILIVADCTGHGVPGAFMASLGNAFLHEIINEHDVIEPHMILELLNQKIINSFNSRGGSQMHDGMDMGVVVIYEDKKELHFSGAKHPMYLVRDGEVERIKGSPYSLGGKVNTGKPKRFEKKIIQIKDGDKIYMSSDGFQDQFGGAENRKYLRNKFQNLILTLGKISMQDHKDYIAKELVNWMGTETQTDDILLVGVEL